MWLVKVILISLSKRCTVFKFMGYNQSIFFDIRKSQDFLVFLSGGDRLASYHHLIKVWEKVSMDDRKV
jgi:hypothetical protein